MVSKKPVNSIRALKAFCDVLKCGEKLLDVLNLFVFFNFYIYFSCSYKFIVISGTHFGTCGKSGVVVLFIHSYRKCVVYIQLSSSRLNYSNLTIDNNLKLDSIHIIILYWAG